ncbi:MAG: hypothetical protein V3T86_01445 [Planctomycetota bacterium]
MEHTGKQRIRPRLVILLWIWAVLIFTVVDLFLNVTEFDAVRPQVRWYRAARFTAHKMVGEPYRERDEFATSPDRAPVLVVATPPDSRPPPRVRVIDGEAPDARTAELIVLRLRAFNDRTDDPVQRAAIDRAILRYTNRED